jgi:non-specific serine/threonine protein kinase
MATAIARQPGNLPGELTSFIGRRRELAEAKRLLSISRLVTFTGVGGVGKTRLALRTAAELRRTFPDGVWLVDLAPLVAGELLEQTVAEALGFKDQSGLNTLPDYLGTKQLLMVLDNCEHLLDECAALASKLLGMAPELRILATSRQMLHVEGEHVLDVQPLPVPEEVTPDAVAQYEAVRLFEERTSAVVPGFAVNAANNGAVTRLCQQLDGIPLAIELAAVQMRALSAEQILDRLDDRFRLLTRGSPAAMPRQQALRALIDWSYDLCSAEERTLWERLSIFSGGCDLAAAEAVCSGEGIAHEDVLYGLIALVDKSILLRKEYGSGSRYEMLETLRRYGRSRLVESGAETALRRRHRDWCRDLASHAEAEWFGAHQMEWLTRLRLEQANVRTALDFCLREPGEAWAALEIAAAMWCHRLSWSSLTEGHHWLERALTLEPGPSVARAKALWVDAWLVLLRGDPVGAAPLLEECGALAEQLGDEAELASAVQITGFAALLAGDFPRAIDLLEEALTRHRMVGDLGRSWVTLFQLAMATTFQGDARSAAVCQECLEICERENAQWSTSYALWVAGLDGWRRGDPQGATTMIRDAMERKLPYNDHLGIAQCIEVLAWIAADEHREDERGAELLGAAQVVWRSIGTSLRGLGHLASFHDQCDARLRQSLGDDAFTKALSRGSQLTLDDAVSYALNKAPAKGAEATRTESVLDSVLTRREREIAALVAQGLGNKEIAATLVIAQRTAEGHIERILRKLGFTSRSQIAAAWVAHQQADRGEKPG